MNFNSAKQEIKDRINLVDIVSSYTQLTPSGKNLKGNSPFSNEKTPSFFVNPVDNVYYCFSTQKGGDVFTFLQEMEGLTFMEALKLLAKRAGIELDENSGIDKGKYQDLYSELTLAKDFFLTQVSADILKILKGRGLNEETIKRWELGYAPNAWNSLCKKDDSKKDDKVSVGLCVKKEDKFYDRFRDRIIFPFFDTSDRVIAFSGRSVGGDGDVAKYINSPETTLFHKSRFLYGLHLAKNNIRKNDFSILVEGPIDVLMIHQAGFPLAVAASGTSVTEEHLYQLKNLSNRILLALDGDSSGIKATIRTAKIALKLGMEVKVITLPDKSDPAELIASEAGVEKWRTSMKNASPIVDFMLSSIEKRYPEEGQDRIRAVKEEVFPVISNIKDSLLKDYASNSVSKFCGISKEAVSESLKELVKDSDVLQVAFKPNRVGDRKETLKNETASFATYFRQKGIELDGDLDEILREVSKRVDLVDIPPMSAELRFKEIYASVVEKEIEDVLLKDFEKIIKELFTILLKEEISELTIDLDSDLNQAKISSISKRIKSFS